MLVEMMREKGVIKFQGNVPDAPTHLIVDLLLGPPAPVKAKEGEKDPRAGKRAHYANLLGRTAMTDEELDLLPDGT